MMKNYKLGDMELKFANLIWENEPISSGEIVKLCEQTFQWKKSTTYTMLKRLTDKGIFLNNSGSVHSLISKQEWYTKQSEGFVTETFNGSLPQFLAAFTRQKKLSKREIDEIQKIINQNAGEIIMSDKIFIDIVNMSLVGSFAIIITMIARLCLKKAPKIFSYALWAVAFSRLIIPFSFESFFSILPFTLRRYPRICFILKLLMLKQA